MKPNELVFFLKYPYATAVIACIWIGSSIMLFIDRNLPVVAVICINTLVSWVIAWSSFRLKDSI